MASIQGKRLANRDMARSSIQGLAERSEGHKELVSCAYPLLVELRHGRNRRRGALSVRQIMRTLIKNNVRIPRTVNNEISPWDSVSMLPVRINQLIGSCRSGRTAITYCSGRNTLLHQHDDVIRSNASSASISYHFMT